MARETDDFIATDWRYRTEGGQHLIFAYEGTSQCYCNKILRIRSIKTATCTDVTDFPLCDELDAFKALHRTELQSFLLTQSSVPISVDALAFFRESSLGLRPLERIETNTIPTTATTGIMQYDLARLFGNNTLCLEVKPKCAVLMKSRLVHPSICASLSKFTELETHIRNFDGKAIREMRRNGTLYNPSELMSGQESQIKRSLEILLASKSRWLRLMAHGNFVAATDQVANNLPKKILSYDDLRCNLAISVASKALAQRPQCLDFLMRMQSLDYVDKLGLEAIWKRLMCLLGQDNAAGLVWKCYLEATSLHSNGSDDDLIEWKSMISYESPEEALRQHDIEKYRAATQVIETMPPTICARFVADAIMSGAAKDCSVLVSMAPVGDGAQVENHQTVTDDRGIVWKFKIHVIDIGPKSLSKIRIWADMDRRLATVSKYHS